MACHGNGQRIEDDRGIYSPARQCTDHFREENAKIVKPRNKVDIPMRLDPDIVEFFKKEGPSYQTRIHAVLRTCMKARTGNRA